MSPVVSSRNEPGCDFSFTSAGQFESDTSFRISRSPSLIAKRTLDIDFGRRRTIREIANSRRIASDNSSKSAPTRRLSSSSPEIASFVSRKDEISMLKSSRSARTRSICVVLDTSRVALSTDISKNIQWSPPPRPRPSLAALHPRGISSDSTTPAIPRYDAGPQRAPSTSQRWDSRLLTPGNSSLRCRELSKFQAGLSPRNTRNLVTEGAISRNSAKPPVFGILGVPLEIWLRLITTPPGSSRVKDRNSRRWCGSDDVRRHPALWKPRRPPARQISSQTTRRRSLGTQNHLSLQT